MENFLLDGLIWLPNTMINRSFVILQKSKLSFSIRKILISIMQQNINSQCHTLGKKKLGRNAALAGRIIYSYYLLAEFNCNIPVCITACTREVGELSSRSIKKNFLSDKHLCAETD